MITKIPRVLILLVVCILLHQHLFSQHISRDNNEGFWEDPLTWNPTWSSPQKFITGYEITIYGYVTVQSFLNFFGEATKLIVNDTLVVRGNLHLGNNNDLIINDQGILIVRGNLYIDEHSRITTNGYLIITGDIYKDNYHHFGSFISNDDPPKVFIGGSVYPEEITDDFPNYPVLNCSSPQTPYPNSKCSRGNMDDLKEDPIYPFFQTTCNIYSPPARISVCPGDSIHLTVTGGMYYSWNGPANFTSNVQNPLLVDADSAMSGIYTVLITADYDCEATDTINVLVNPLPAVTITSIDDTLCLNDQRTLTGSPAGGKFSVEGPVLFTDNILKATDVGKINIKYLYRNVCSNTDSQTIVVNPLVAVSILGSEDTLCLNDQCTLTGTPAGGIFTVEKGPGLMIATHILKATDVGEILIEYSLDKVCSNTPGQTIISSPWPSAEAGTNQELKFHFKTKLGGSLQPLEKGTWSLVSGTGHFEDIHSPETNVTGLSLGENVFLWTVNNGACESSSQVTIIVLDLVVPSVFTPNDDGTNDNFVIENGGDPFEITVFNQWGIVEYESNSNVNGWDGRNNKGNDLPADTYFYVLKFESGQTKKGTVLIVK